MPKVSEEYMRSRRAGIVQAARSVFVQKGYCQSSMSDVIAAAGLSAGAIYNHFTGKTELMVAAATVDLSVFDAALGELPWDYVERCLCTLRDDAELTKILALTWGEAVTEPAIRKVAQEQLTDLRNRIVESYRGWAATELEMTESERESWLSLIGSAVLAVVTGFVVQAATVTDFDSDSYFEFARTILKQA